MIEVKTRKQKIRTKAYGILKVASCLPWCLIPDAWSLAAAREASIGCPSALFGKIQNRDGDTAHVPEILPVEGALKEASGCQVFIFVSFSMPEASLKSLSQEVDRMSENAVCRPILLMRGLHQDSFVKTVEKLRELGISVDINPELFEAHQVTTVPTFVLVKYGKAISRLKGNVTLTFAMETFKSEEAGKGVKEGGTLP